MNQRKAGVILSYTYIIVTNTISLFYTPYMLSMLGQHEYGLYGTASSFVSYLSVLNFGISAAYIRFNALARAKHDADEEKRLNGMFLTIYSILALLVAIGGVILILLSGVLVENTFSDEELFKLRVLIAILIVNMMVTFISNVFMMALQSYERFFFIRMALLICGVAQPIVNVIVMHNGGKSIGITFSSFVVSLVSYIVMYIYAKKSIKFSVSFKGFNKSEFRALFVFSGYLMLNSITNQITFSTDNIILSSVSGTVAVAIYTIGASFKGYFQNFSSTIGNVFCPQINKIVAEKGSISQLDEVFLRVGRIQFYVVSLVMIGYATIGDRFVWLWVGDDYSDSFYIGLLLMIAVFVPAFQNVGIEIQQALNMHKARSIVYFLIAVVNVAMSIPFSIWWGGIGAAAATAICMFFGTVVFMNWYYSKRVGLNIKEFWISISKILPGFILPIIVGVLFRVCVNIDSLLMFIVAALAILITYVFSVWFISMNDYEKNLVKKPFIKIKNKLVRKNG